MLVEFYKLFSYNLGIYFSFSGIVYWSFSNLEDTNLVKRMFYHFLIVLDSNFNRYDIDFLYNSQCNFDTFNTYFIDAYNDHSSDFIIILYLCYNLY